MSVMPATNMSGAKSTLGLLGTGLSGGPMGALKAMPNTARVTPPSNAIKKKRVLLRITYPLLHTLVNGRNLVRFADLHDGKYLKEEHIGQGS